MGFWNRGGGDDRKEREQAQREDIERITAGGIPQGGRGAADARSAPSPAGVHVGSRACRSSRSSAGPASSRSPRSWVRRVYHVGWQFMGGGWFTTSQEL